MGFFWLDHSAARPAATRILHVQLGWLVLAEETLLILLRGIASGHAASCTANICHVDESAEVAVGVDRTFGQNSIRFIIFKKYQRSQIYLRQPKSIVAGKFYQRREVYQRQ